MFGLVPKTIWQRMAKPDEHNRIVIGLNSLLVRDGRNVVLVDTGMGDKWDAKSVEIYGLRREPGLVAELARVGVRPDDVTHVLFSHLHLDHAGGNTRRGADGGLEIVFPNARHIAQHGEWMDAFSGHPAKKDSYTLDDLTPIRDAGLMDLIEGDTEILPGIRTWVTGGHTEFHQAVIVESEGAGAIFLADLMPTANHLKPHYHMGYDLFPIVIGESRVKAAEMILDRDWLCVFEHDATTPMARMRRGDDGKLRTIPV